METEYIQAIKPTPEVMTNEIAIYFHSLAHPALTIELLKNKLIMKIFYAVQATGNGHISRAMELLALPAAIRISRYFSKRQ